jgi:hypothetical protein
MDKIDPLRSTEELPSTKSRVTGRPEREVKFKSIGEAP